MRKTIQTSRFQNHKRTREGRDLGTQTGGTIAIVVQDLQTTREVETAAAAVRNALTAIVAARTAGRGDVTTTGLDDLLRHLVAMERIATMADDEVGRVPHMAVSDAVQARARMVMTIFLYHDGTRLKCRTCKSLPKMTRIGKLPQSASR